MSERIEVALPSDQNYIHGLIVTAVSMAVYIPVDTVLSINVLDGGIDDASFQDFQQIVRRYHGRTEFRRCKVDEKSFDGLPVWAGNRMTYARLLLPEFLADCDFVIYCDTDFLWTTDVSPVWNCRNRNVPIMGALDLPAVIEIEERWFSARGLPFFKEKYFGGGMMLLNLQYFRENHIVRHICDFLTKHPDVQYADQTAFNALLQKGAQMIDQRFHTLSNFVGGKNVSGYGIHFPGEKAWKRLKFRSGPYTDFQMFWCEFYASIIGSTKLQVAHRWNSYPQLIFHRIMFKVGVSNSLKWFMVLPLKLIGNEVRVDVLRKWCRPFGCKYLLEVVKGEMQSPD